MKINIKVKDIMIFLVWLLMFPIPYISQRANNLLALTIEVVIFSWLMSKSNIRYLIFAKRVLVNWCFFTIYSFFNFI